MRQPVRAALASYPTGAPAMFVTHVSARKNWERAFVRGVMLLSAYRAGAECRLSQADAAWVRNVIADTENFLPDLLREVP